MQQCPECYLPLQQPAARCPSCDADLTRPRGRPGRPQPPKTEPTGVEEVRRAVRATPPGMPLPPPAMAPRGTMIESVENLRAVPLAPPPVAPMPSVPASPPTPVATPKTAPPSKKPAGPRPTEPMSNEPVKAKAKAGAQRDTWSEPTPPPSDTTPYRPLNRPPMAVLIALDDGSREEGEVWRVRQSPFVIGRASGDAVIPHDGEISGQHAQLSCRVESGAFKWYLKDLQSTNGTFLRAARIPLRDGQQLLIGTRRYEYRSASAVAATVAANPDSGEVAVAKSTSNWQIPSQATLERMESALVEITPNGDGRRYPLPSGEATIGGSRQADVQILGDPFVSPIHAKLTGDANRRYLENQGSLNGLWIRIQEERIDQNCEIQCGEQRFLVRFP